MYKNTAVTVTILVWDVLNGVGKTGDAANLTLRGVGDGGEYTPSSPSITEIDSTNLKGVYSVALTAGENNYSINMIGGKSSTSGVVIQPISWTNECSVTSSAVASVTADVNVSASSITAIAAAVWAVGTRTLTSFGTLIADIFAHVVDGTITFAQSLKLSDAANAGKTSGMAAANPTAVIRNPDDTVDRITAAHDSNGNRTSVTYDFS